MVKCHGLPVSVGIGRYCFPIENGKVDKEIGQEIGSKVKGEESKFNDYYDLAVWAWTNKEFDSIEEN